MISKLIAKNFDFNEKVQYTKRSERRTTGLISPKL